MLVSLCSLKRQGVQHRMNGLVLACSTRSLDDATSRLELAVRPLAQHVLYADICSQTETSACTASPAG